MNNKKINVRETLKYIPSIDEILTYYMGKNTQDRQEYIINNLIDYGIEV